MIIFNFPNDKSNVVSPHYCVCCSNVMPLVFYDYATEVTWGLLEQWVYISLSFSFNEPLAYPDHIFCTIPSGEIST
jgi:hypothetical protein